MVIVDTSVWIDYLAGTRNLQTDWIRGSLDHRQIGLTDLILCEVLQGVRGDAASMRVEHELSAFALFALGNRALATAAAHNYRLLRSRGHTIRTTIDCMIASFCVMEGHALLHNDRDFVPFETFLGLRVIHPRRT